MTFTQIELVSKRLFDKDALGATNFGFSPGSSRDVTAEQIASEINKALSQIESGDFKFVDLNQLDSDRPHS